MQNKRYVLAIDQGTTSTRAILFNGECEPIGKVQREFKQIYPQPGYVEHDPMEILDTVISSMRGVIDLAKISFNDIAAIGITNQRETAVVWNRETGLPICNAIVWQCRRTAEYCLRLKTDGYENLIYDKTGLMPDAYFSATKVKWILENVPETKQLALQGKLAFGTIDTFLMWHLSGGKIFATDYTNASRTMLYNIHSLTWDKDLLKMFGISENILPEVKPSSGLFGYTKKEMFGCEIPITGVAGDQQASLFGQNCFSPGEVKNTYGTGCFMLMNTGEVAIKSTHGLITTLAASLAKSGKPQYVLEGSVFVGGAAVQWLRDEMCLIKTSDESEECAKKVPDSGGVYVVPAFVGLGAPHWDSLARGMICGITRGTKKEHIVRATLESIAYQSYDLLRAMEKDTALKIPYIKVDGGASANNFLMQFQADVCAVKVVRSLVVETTALGAALLAGLNVGLFAKSCLTSNGGVKGDVFSPMCAEGVRQDLLIGWATAVGRTRYR